MKSFFTCLAFASSLASLAFAAPAIDNALVKRLGPTDEPAALARMDTLFSDITKFTAVINGTAKSLHSTSSASKNATAAMVFEAAIKGINHLVVKATSDVSKLDKREFELVERQTTPAGGLPAELALIIEEIGGALNMIIATLGLTATLSFLGPLVGSLSALLASLIPVVNNLLTVVAELVDGILGGLSLALAGLVL